MPSKIKLAKGESVWHQLLARHVGLRVSLPFTFYCNVLGTITYYFSWGAPIYLSRLLSIPTQKGDLCGDHVCSMVNLESYKWHDFQQSSLLFGSIDWRYKGDCISLGENRGKMISLNWVSWCIFPFPVSSVFFFFLRFLLAFFAAC